MNRKARKEHRCDLCELPIEKGAVYDDYDCVPWDGVNEDFGKFRTHLDCNEIYYKFSASSFNDDYSCRGWEFWADIWEEDMEQPESVNKYLLDNNKAIVPTESKYFKGSGIMEFNIKEMGAAR